MLRETVLSAAERELRASGAGGFAVERVAAAADVAVQTVYNHFGGRDGLLLAVAERALQVDRAFMDDAYAVASPVERVEQAAAAYARFALEYPEHFRLLAFPPGPPFSPEASHGPSAAIAERVAAGVQLQNDRLVTALRDGMEVGRIRALDPERSATAMWAMLNGLLALSWRADRLRTSAEETTELFAVAVDILRNGLEVAEGTT